MYDELMSNKEVDTGLEVHFNAHIVQVQENYGGNYNMIARFANDSMTHFIWLDYSGDRISEGENVEGRGAIKGLRSYEIDSHVHTVPEIDVLILELRK